MSADDPSYSLHQIPPLTNPTNERELMANLSPAAQAVLAAYHKEAIDYIESWGSFSHKRGIAAALQAAADQVVPEPNDTDKALLSLAAIRNHCKVRDRFLAIAAELEGQ